MRSSRYGSKAKEHIKITSALENIGDGAFRGSRGMFYGRRDPPSLFKKATAEAKRN